METCLLSQLLFQYMSRIFGSEKAVRARRLYYGVEDCCSITSAGRFVSSGSKAEGLDYLGSDLDVMFIQSSEVYSDVRSCYPNDFPRLFISTNNTHPGFAHIYVQDNPHNTSYCQTLKLTEMQKPVDVIHTGNGIKLQNRSFKNMFSLYFAFDGPGSELNDFMFKTHGPCQSLIDDTFDLMVCFKLHSWPNVASSWILRRHLFDWPPPNVISNIIHERILLAPVGSRCGSSQDNPNEWRISFSLVEKLLVHSFNHTQLMCYVLLKILLKEIINRNVITKDLLCSYFMKTILFWTIEETGCAVWTPSNLVKCFSACITKLLHLLKHKHLPNYFIPESNMIDGKFSEESLSNLCTLLDLVNSEGVGFTLRTDTLQGFLTTEFWRFTNTYNDEETNVLWRCLTGENIYFSILFESLNRYQQRRDILLLNTFKMFETKLIRNMFYCIFLNRMTNAPFCAQYDVNRSNKSLYHNYKSVLGYSLIGAKQSLFSWLPVAIIFYSHKNYINTLKITDFIHSENLFMKERSLNSILGRLTTLQKVKLRYCKSLSTLNLFYSSDSDSLIGKTDLCLNFQRYESVPLSRPFSTYIRFMCFHHLKNVGSKRSSLFDLLEMLLKIQPLDELICQFQRVFRAYNLSHRIVPENLIIKYIESLRSRDPFAYELYVTFFELLPQMPTYEQQCLRFILPQQECLSYITPVADI